MDCFDADVLIYAAVADDPLGAKVRSLLSRGPAHCAGSVLLLPEVLAEPLRNDAEEVRELTVLLAQLELLPCDKATAELATALAARYRLRAADSVHCATAVALGADRFITNNRRDFTPAITEVDVVYPADLPDPSTPD